MSKAKRPSVSEVTVYTKITRNQDARIRELAAYTELATKSALIRRLITLGLDQYEKEKGVK